ncbi:MAG: DUF1540 domain-containing protein [Myxococcales bacterium]|jgi:hypothetical protein|nr:DUF1540 domain-containing protein [Myxococcales bacterium]
MNMIPPVVNCDVERCFFNSDQKCHAGAITVGSSEPRCETFSESSVHSSMSSQAEVGACHVTDCRHNSQMRCSANGIEVVIHGDHGDCQTFEQH